MAEICIPGYAVIYNTPITPDYTVNSASELTTALSSCFGGENILCNPGSYGNYSFSGYSFASDVMVYAENRTATVFTQLAFTGTSDHIKVYNVSVEPRGTTAAAVDINASSYITIDGCDINFSDTSYLTWTDTQWGANTGSGVLLLSATYCTISNNLVTATAGNTSSPAAIRTVYGSNHTISGNTITGIGGDGIKVGATDMLIDNNLIRNFYNVSTEHNDGIQFWTATGVGHTDVTVTRNIIIQQEDPGQLYAEAVQGIGAFDYVNTRIYVENNLVIIGHQHGITLGHAVDSRIINNTVLHIDRGSVTPPYDITLIEIADIKGHGTPLGNICRNNVANGYTLTGTTSSNNETITRGTEASYFVDPLGADGLYDYHLLAGASTLRNAGTAIDAPSIDIEGTSRPQESIYDIGAYEYTV